MPESMHKELSATIETRAYPFRFDMTIESERRAYQALGVRLKESNGSCFNVWAGPEKGFTPYPGQVVHLETKFIFNNQWNTACGFRVFDWYEGIVPNRDIKIGYWLDMVPEIAEIRRNTVACGYCGHQEPAAMGNVFCGHCLKSPYLNEETLPLLRLLNFEGKAKRPPLTGPELDHLMPLYITAQIERRDRDIVKQRADLAHKYEKAAESARTEYDGFLWLLDNGVNTENCIFYSHTGRFGFGWRKPVSDSVYSKLVEVLCEFPFDYDIKTETDQSRV